MVTLNLSDSFCTTNPTVVASPGAFIFMLGNDKTMVPSTSRYLGDPQDAIRNGSPFQINLSPGANFNVEDVIFENLVKNAAGGGNSEFLNRLLHYVSTGVIEVRQDGGSPLTAKEVFNYTAP